MTTILEKALKYDLKNQEYNPIALKTRIEKTLNKPITKIQKVSETNYQVLETTFTFDFKPYVIWLYVLETFNNNYYIVNLEIERVDD